jgi:hypothetical protein
LRNKHAAVAQSVARVIGNDEVGSSNLPSSSRRILETTMVSRIFSIFCKQLISDVFQQIFQQNCLRSGYMAASSLTSSGFSARI